MSSFSDIDRQIAQLRFRLIQPFFDGKVPLTRLARHNQIPLRTARRWVADYRTHGLIGLCRQPRSDRQKRRVPETLHDAIEGFGLRNPPLSAASIHRQIKEIAKSHGLKAPSYATVYDIIRKIDPALREMAVEGTKAYSDKYELVYRREATSPNAIWQADHTELDIYVLDETGTTRRPWLTVVLDDYSRAIAGYFITFLAPSSIQTALALRQAIWRKSQAAWHVCGIPEVLYVDHGSDFTSNHIEQVCTDLKIRMIFSTIAKPRGRGKIERFFLTVNQMFLQEQPGYSPAGKAQSAKLTISELSRRFERFIVDDYHLNPHSTTDVAPQLRWEAGGFLPNMPKSLEQLDLLLLTVIKTRRVHSDGIKFSGHRYISPTLAGYVGEQVILRYDPRDMAEVRVFYGEQFLCRAICQELAGDTISLRELNHARKTVRTRVRKTIVARRRTVDSLIEVRRGSVVDEEPAKALTTVVSSKLRRYKNE